VSENNQAYACGYDFNGSYWADYEYISIELSNSATGGDWPVSQETYDTAVQFVRSIFKSRGFGKAVLGQNLTYHGKIGATECPGGMMRNKFEQFVKDVNKEGGAVATRIITYPATCRPNQLWELVPVGDCVLFRSATGNGALDVEGWGGKSARVVLWEETGAANQLWEIDKNEGGTVRIRSKSNGLSMDASGNDGKPNREIITYDGTAGNNQKFRLLKFGDYYMIMTYNMLALDAEGRA
jgi:hypothetical protein